MDVAVPLITDAIEEDSNIDVGKLVDDLVSDSLLQVRSVKLFSFLYLTSGSIFNWLRIRYQ